MIEHPFYEWSAMKIFQDQNYKTVCGPFGEWELMQREFKGAEKVSILDLRPLAEASTDKLTEIPEGWVLEPHPVSGRTVSEQDFDVFRREVRRYGNLIAVGTNEAHGALLVLADQARRERRGFDEQAVTALGEMERVAELKAWLDSYLTRHRDTEVIGEF